MGIFDDAKRKMRNRADDREKAKIAKDRVVLDKMVTDIRGIPFSKCRGILPDELIGEYRKAADQIIDIINNVDPTKEDTWEIDTQINDIIGELTDAVQRKATGGIGVCFRALKYAAVTRQMDIPAKHEIKKYMDGRVKSLESYRVIIANQKVMDATERDIMDQRAMKAHRLDEQDDAVKKVKDYRAANPIAAKKILEKDYGPETLELRTLMNRALDLKNQIKSLEIEIAANLDKVTAANALINEQEAFLINSNEDISQEAIELAREARERQLKHLDETRAAIDSIREETTKHADILEEMTKTTAEKQRYTETNRKFESLETELREKPLREQEAKTAMIKAETEGKKKEIEALEKLKAEEAKYEAAKDELENLKNREQEQVVENEQEIEQEQEIFC